MAEDLGRRSGAGRKHLWAVAALMAVGVATCGLSSTAFANNLTGTMSVTPTTGLTNGESVSVTGSGFTPSGIGNFLECNDAPSEPNVALPSPVSNSVGVGCSAISYSLLVTVSSTGTISKSFTISEGTVGPPCGKSTDAIATCPAMDTNGNSPAADAALYPCPPTAAQLAAGDQCQLNFGDDDGDSAPAVNLTFQGESTTTTTAPATTTTVAKTTTTTVAKTTTTTAGGTTGTTAASTGDTGASTAAAGGTATSSLASTGAGPPLWWLLFIGLMLITLSGVLWLAGPRVWRGRLAARSSHSDV